MPYKYQVFTALPLEEVGEVKYDSIDGNDLISINNVGRRPAKHNFGTDFDGLETRLQSATTALNMTTFSCWVWFNSDIPVNDVVLLSRGQWGAPIWAIRTLSGNIVFEVGDGIGFSFSIVGPKVLQGDHFVAISYNNTTGEMVLYYDGAVVATGQSPLNMPTTPIGIAVGSYVDGGVWFNGWTDSILFTSLVLTTTDLDVICDGGAGRDCPWFWDNMPLGSICIIKKDKYLLVERQQIDIQEKDKLPVIEIQCGRK